MIEVGLAHQPRQLGDIRRNRPLTEKPEDPLSSVDPPASMSRNEMESSWGKCEADMIRGPLATRRLSLSSHFESSQFPRLTAARAASRCSPQSAAPCLSQVSSRPVSPSISVGRAVSTLSRPTGWASKTGPRRREAARGHLLCFVGSRYSSCLTRYGVPLGSLRVNFCCVRYKSALSANRRG